jgi:putative acetyltransferase
VAFSSDRSSDPTIRGYEAGDQAGFEQLVRSVHQEFGFDFDACLDADLVNPLATYVRTWVLAAPDGSIVGSVALKESGEGVEIKRMYLDLALRGHGRGASLLETATDWAREAGYTYMELDTAEHQTNAQKLYERSGFKLIRRSDRVSGPGTLYYRLALEPRPRRDASVIDGGTTP